MTTPVITRNFSGGELGPAVYGRADVAKYQEGLRTCRNFIVRRHGGVANRPGLEFIARVKDSAIRTRLFPFVFNNDQTYLIEAGFNYFRIYQNGVLQSPTGAAPWSPLTTYATGDLVTQAGVTYYAFQASTNQDPLTAATFWYPQPAGIYEVPTDYTEEELPQIKYTQSLDVLTFVHRNSQPSELRRTLSGSDIRWRFEVIIVQPKPATPQNGLAAPGVTGSINWRYQVTAAGVDYEESLPSASFLCIGGEPTTQTPNRLTWDPVPGSLEYYVYRESVPDSGIYCYIDTADSNRFSDPWILPDTTSTPPIQRDPFPGILDKPGAVTYFQQRLAMGGSYNRPEDIELSRTGKYHNFAITSPIQDDNAISVTLAGQQYNELRHLLVVRKQLLALTEVGEWVITGDGDGVLKPAGRNADQDTHFGSSHVAPVVVGDVVVFTQARGNLVRSLVFVQEQAGYSGNDLTIFAPHLFEGHVIERLALQEVPNSVVWAQRSDGVLLGLTFLPAEGLWGWHHHDTDGAFEDVCVVPEGEEDANYFIVRRVIDGQAVRYIERMAPVLVKNIAVDAAFMDSFAVYDGRNVSAIVMHLTSPTNAWTSFDLLTLHASTSYFQNSDVDNAIVLQVGVEQVKITIASNVDGFSATGYANRTVPEAFRDVDVAIWARAADEITGLGHLEGRMVSILADGNVLPPQVVVAGKITLPTTSVFVRVGLPIVADFETLDMDRAEIRDKRKLVRSVSLVVEATRGFWKGPDAAHLTEYRSERPQSWRMPPQSLTETIEVDLASTWNGTGRFFIRHIDPLPLTINAAIPRLDLGG